VIYVNNQSANLKKIKNKKNTKITICKNYSKENKILFKK